MYPRPLPSVHRWRETQRVNCHQRETQLCCVLVSCTSVGDELCAETSRVPERRPARQRQVLALETNSTSLLSVDTFIIITPAPANFHLCSAGLKAR